MGDLKRQVIAAAFDSIDLESIEDEASINALYMSANKVIAARAEDHNDGCDKGGKGGKKNPASQLDGARAGAEEEHYDNMSDRLQSEMVALSNGHKKKEA